MPPESGAISYSTSMSQTSTFDFGTTATFSCDSGFAVSGSAERTCHGDGSNLIGVWDGNDPSCVGKPVAYVICIHAYTCTGLHGNSKLKMLWVTEMFLLLTPCTYCLFYTTLY